MRSMSGTHAGGGGADARALRRDHGNGSWRLSWMGPVRGPGHTGRPEARAVSSGYFRVRNKGLHYFAYTTHTPGQYHA